jgi:hypothetical protein
MHSLRRKIEKFCPLIMLIYILYSLFFPLIAEQESYHNLQSQISLLSVKS